MILIEVLEALEPNNTDNDGNNELDIQVERSVLTNDINNENKKKSSHIQT